MSIFHSEKQRICKRCGHTWHAEKYDHRGGLLLAIEGRKRASAYDLLLQAEHQQRNQRVDKYRYCPNCGSKKAKDVTRPASQLPAVPQKLSKRATKKQTEVLAKEREQRAAFEAKAATQRQKQAGLRRKDVAQAFAQPPYLPTEKVTHP